MPWCHDSSTLCKPSQMQVFYRVNEKLYFTLQGFHKDSLNASCCYCLVKLLSSVLLFNVSVGDVLVYSARQ